MCLILISQSVIRPALTSSLVLCIRTFSVLPICSNQASFLSPLTAAVKLCQSLKTLISGLGSSTTLGHQHRLRPHSWVLEIISVIVTVMPFLMGATETVVISHSPEKGCSTRIAPFYHTCCDVSSILYLVVVDKGLGLLKETSIVEQKVEIPFSA